MPLIEKVPSKAVGGYQTRGREAVGNNKVVRSTASMNRNILPTFVVCVDRCCAEIRRRSKQARSACISAGFDTPMPGRVCCGCDPTQLHNERDLRRRGQKDSKSNNVCSSQPRSTPPAGPELSASIILPGYIADGRRRSLKNRRPLLRL